MIYDQKDKVITVEAVLFFKQTTTINTIDSKIGGESSQIIWQATCNAQWYQFLKVFPLSGEKRAPISRTSYFPLNWFEGDTGNLIGLRNFNWKHFWSVLRGFEPLYLEILVLLLMWLVFVLIDLKTKTRQFYIKGSSHDYWSNLWVWLDVTPAKASMRHG